jgi:anti-sigma factor RsiW
MNKPESIKTECLETRNAILLGQESPTAAEHLQSCPACHQQESQLYEQAGRLRALMVEYPSFKPDWSQLHARILHEENEPRGSLASYLGSLINWLQLPDNFALNLALVFIIASGMYFSPATPGKTATEQQKFVITTSQKLERLARLINADASATNLNIQGEKK